MKSEHPLHTIVQLQKSGVPAGIFSVCSANDMVIAATMQRVLVDNDYILIEATANQVNQFGGYTGMNPADFKRFVYSLADQNNFSVEKIILGGDHLGPLVWKEKKSGIAMEEAKELIREFVMAGFTKIHIDTSMHLADDDKDRTLDISIIAERGAILAEVAEKAYQELQKKHPDSLHPVYVVGSEVPIPGGSQEEEDSLHITEVKDLEETISSFKMAFHARRLDKAWESVIAVVVQPGVEFGEDSIHEYDRDAARELCAALKNYSSLVFEGHSTDYQPEKALRQMVEDGIAILKVGPALTFALREALFALTEIEEELFRYNENIQLSKFRDILEDEMLTHPENWQNHYHGSNSKVTLARKYSFSDRCRYYIPSARISNCISRLMSNLMMVDIPLTLLSQYMPIQYTKIINGKLNKNPESLVKDRIINCIDEYIATTKCTLKFKKKEV